MKRLMLAAIVCLLFGCQTDYAPPIVSPDKAGKHKGQYVDLGRLQEGRRLFANRCIDCHTLPVVWHYNSNEWPRIVDSMAHRASLKPNERDAIVAYILAVRSL